MLRPKGTERPKGRRKEAERAKTPNKSNITPNITPNSNTNVY